MVLKTNMVLITGASFAMPSEWFPTLLHCSIRCCSFTEINRFTDSKKKQGQGCNGTFISMSKVFCYFLACKLFLISAMCYVLCAMDSTITGCELEFVQVNLCYGQYNHRLWVRVCDNTRTCLNPVMEAWYLTFPWIGMSKYCSLEFIAQFSV